MFVANGRRTGGVWFVMHCISSWSLTGFIVLSFPAKKFVWHKNLSNLARIRPTFSDSIISIDRLIKWGVARNWIIEMGAIRLSSLQVSHGFRTNFAWFRLFKRPVKKRLIKNWCFVSAENHNRSLQKSVRKWEYNAMVYCLGGIWINLYFLWCPENFSLISIDRVSQKWIFAVNIKKKN